jgi:hypothetical protein
MGFLSGNNNVVLVSQCNNLQGLSRSAIKGLDCN